MVTVPAWFERLRWSAAVVAAAALAVAAVTAIWLASARDARAILTPTVTSSVHNVNHNIVTSTTLGATVHFAVNVTGSAGPATGNVQATFYGDATCTSGVSTTTVALSGGVADSILSVSPGSLGTFSYRGIYLGSGTYSPRAGGCVTFTVLKAVPTVSLAFHLAGHTSITGAPYGVKIHFATTVTGPAGPGIGVVDLVRYSDPDCKNLSAIVYGGKPLVNGVLDDGSLTVQGPAGATAWRFKLRDSANYVDAQSPCRTFTVTKAPTTVSSVVHDPSHQVVTEVPLGTPVHTFTTVVGTFSAPTGTIRVETFSAASCSTASSTGFVNIGLVNGSIDGGGTTSRGVPTANFLRVTYLGDSNYLSSAGPCHPISWKATPSVTQQLFIPGGSGSVAPLGVGVTDNITVSGGFGTPTGAVRVRIFPNSTCSGSPSVDASAPLSGGETSSGINPGRAGSFSFLVNYNGDATYLPGPGDCLAFTIAKGAPALAATVHDASHEAVSSVPEGSTLHAAVVLSGVTGIDLTGSVSPSLFGNGSCTGSPIATGSAASVGGGAIDLTGFTRTLSPGSYGFLVHYTGDSNYLAVDDCASVIVLAPGATPPPTVAPGTPPPSSSLGPGSSANATPGATLAPGETPGLSAEPGASGAGPGSTLTASGPGATGGAGATAVPGGEGRAGGSGGGIDPVVLAIIVGAFLIGLSIVAVVRRWRAVGRA